ncbi:hypothetical protein [Glycomyces sp. NPDC048151]|uniref:hypothetical protein n=1 Tax=Glycomyces sp. NPDC048151 TaxID=3364002 RepID=UPI0037172908
MERREASAAAAGVRWAAALTVMGLALTGCGANRSAQTSEMAPAISGVDADAGTVALRDMQVDFGERGFYLAGGQAPLRIWMDNQGEEAVVLEAVTSPDAEAVLLAADVVVEEETPGSEATTPAESESPSPETDGSESPSADASETPTGDEASPTGDAASATPEAPVAELVGEQDFAIELAPDSYVRLAPTTGSFLLLDGLKEDLKMGSTVELTFVFSNGEALTVDLPIGTPLVAPSRTYFEPHHEE